MTDRKKITRHLSLSLEKHISRHYDTRHYWAKEVTFNYGTPQECRVDYMKFIPKKNSVSGIEKGDFICYEIKSCKADFETEHGHNFIGDLNYYVIPDTLYQEICTQIPRDIGVITINSDGDIRFTRTPKQKDRTKPISEMLLMMFRSANRELIKLKKEMQEGDGK